MTQILALVVLSSKRPVPATSPKIYHGTLFHRLATRQQHEKILDAKRLHPTIQAPWNVQKGEELLVEPCRPDQDDQSLRKQVRQVIIHQSWTCPL